MNILFYFTCFHIRIRYSILFFFFSSRRRHTRFSRDWSSDVCSSDLAIFTSTDAATWTSRTSGILDQVYQGIAFGNGTFVAVGLQDVLSGVGAIATSTNGITWTRPASLPIATLSGVTHGKGTFVAVGS